MKKNTIKRKIKKYTSNILVASMVLPILAPSLSVKAETSNLENRASISFDLGIYKSFKEHEKATISSEGTPYLLDEKLVYNKDDKSADMQELVPGISEEDKTKRKYELLFAKKADTSEKYFKSYIEDTGANNQDPKSVNEPKNSIEMPWWGYDWLGYGKKVTAYQNAKSDENVEKPQDLVSESIEWNGSKYYFPGYRLEKWYDKDDLTQRPVNKLPLEFPFRDTVYVAKFRSDGTKFKLETKYESKDGVNAPINHKAEGATSGIEDNKLIELDTDKSYQMQPINIVGYKPTLADADIIIKNKGSEEDLNKGTTAYYTVYKWVKDSDNNIGGNVFNKDVSVTYRYEVDHDQKFYVIVNHNKYSLDPEVTDPISRSIDKYKYSVETDLANPKDKDGQLMKVGPKSELIIPQEGEDQAPYILDPSNVKVTAGTEKNINSRLSALEKTRLEDGTESYFDKNHYLQGKMPNQTVIVEYNYKPNPNYKLSVKVNYKDTSGKNISDMIFKKAGITKEQISNALIDSTGTIIMKMNQNDRNESLPLPDLSAEGYEEPNIIVTDNVALAGEVKKHDSKLQINTNVSPYSVDVIYNQKADQFGKLIFDVAGSASLKVDNENYDPDANVVFLKKKADKLIVPKNIATEESIPTIVAHLGYEADGFYATEGGSTKKILNPDGSFAIDQEEYELANIENTYRLRAGVVKKKWKKFHFTVLKNEDLDLPEVNTDFSFYPFKHGQDHAELDLSFNINEIDSLNEQTQAIEGSLPVVDVPVGYKIQWYNDRDIEISATENIATYPDESKFHARIIPDVQFSLNKVDATSQIDRESGSVEIRIAQLNPNPLVVYVLTDENGKIIKKQSSEELNANNKTLTDSSIIPGRTYKLYEVKPNIQIPDPLKEDTDIEKSEPSEVLAKVANPPYYQANDQDKVDTVFEPLNPNMKYALIKADKTVVKPWQSPTDGKIIFKNLNPDEEYTLVVKEANEPLQEKDLDNGLKFTPEFKTSIYRLLIANGPREKYIDEAKEIIEDNEEIDVDLDRLRSGAKLKLKIKNFVDSLPFKTENSIKPVFGEITDPNQVNTFYTFTMPKSNIVLSLIYGHTDFEEPQINDFRNQPETLIPANPGIDDVGKFRVLVDRQEATASDAYIADELADKSLKYVYTLEAKLQKQNTDNSWSDYTRYSGDIYLSIDIGALERKGKEYQVFRIDEENRLVEQSTISDKDLETGIFQKALKNKEKYLFAYYEVANYDVKVIDNRDNNILATSSEAALERSLGEILDDLYLGLPQIDETNIGINGISYTYKGFSSQAETFSAINSSDTLSSDYTVYAFYENDKPKRDKAEADLIDLIEMASKSSEVKVKDAVIKAKEVLDKTSPRKSSTTELLDAYAKLKPIFEADAFITSFLNKSSSKGGSGGASFAGSRNNSQANAGLPFYITYRVGQDGKWKLLDANKHIWAFEFNDSRRITGWANLAYTYNGITKIETYHFGPDGIMDYGWFKDENGDWYYLSELHNGFFGRLVRSWYKDEKDGRWYYLSEKDGKMQKSWQKINGIWYFLNPQNNIMPTWIFRNDKWEYTGNNVRPLGSMYQNERTPDNYFVDENGAWVENK